MALQTSRSTIVGIVIFAMTARSRKASRRQSTGASSKFPSARACSAGVVDAPAIRSDDKKFFFFWGPIPAEARGSTVKAPGIIPRKSVARTDGDPRIKAIRPR